MAAGRRVVIDEGPVPVGETNRLDPGAGIRKRRVTHGAPRLTLVLRGTHADLVVRAVVAHEGDDCPVGLADKARLDVAESEHRLADFPGLPAIVRDRDD